MSGLETGRGPIFTIAGCQHGAVDSIGSCDCLATALRRWHAVWQVARASVAMDDKKPETPRWGCRADSVSCPSAPLPPTDKAVTATGSIMSVLFTGRRDLAPPGCEPRNISKFSTVPATRR